MGDANGLVVFNSKTLECGFSGINHAHRMDRSLSTYHQGALKVVSLHS
jgi:hypothetical protein